jgi:hypothetical protein
VDLVDELLDALAQLLGDLSELRVLLQKLDDLGRLFRRQLLSLGARLRERLAVRGVGVGVRLVAIGLPGLGEQDQRCCIRRLQAEGEVEKNERLEVELGETDDIECDPDDHQDRLHGQEGRRPEEAGKALGSDPEPVVTERRGEMRVGFVKSEVVAGYCL